MKKVLLISNHVFHYRIVIYNYFYSMFKEQGYEFHVLSNEYQDFECDIKFAKHVKEFSIFGYAEEIRRIAPDIVINFLHLKDKLIFPLTLYCRIIGIPMIYWNHGINISKARNKLLNIIYKAIHEISNAIILYTPNELQYVSDRNKRKVFIAYNTLCFDDIDKEKILDKDAVKRKYLIKEDKVILYISRILPYKRLGILLKIFANEKDVALVIAGSGINEEQLAIINRTSNFYYLGPKYGRDVDEIFNMGDIYSTPGHIGLGIIQAFFWGKPVVVLNTRHAPEIYYMKDGVNGYIAHNEKELKEIILHALRTESEYNRLSNNAIKTINDEAHINRMFGGFMNAISYCLDRGSKNT